MDEYRPVKSELIGRRRFKERARAEYIAGAEEEWRRRTGRPLTTEELQRVLRGIRATRSIGRSRWCAAAPSTFGDHCRPRPRASSSA